MFSARSRVVQSSLNHLVECGLLIYAIGFKNFLLEGLPKTDDGQLLVVDGFRVPSKGNICLFFR